MQTLTNSFHNTKTRTHSPLEWEEINNKAEIATHKHPKHRTAQDARIIALRHRIKSALCGMADCKCGTVRH